MRRCLGLTLGPSRTRWWIRLIGILFFYGWGFQSGWAQQVELLTNGEYRPGEYVPLRIETEGPGRVSIRADLSLGIEWDAPGRTSITVPWMTWQASGDDLVLQVNGRSQRVRLKRLEDNQDYSTPNPYQLLARFPALERSEYSDRVYEPTLGWPGGVGADMRWNVAWAGGIIVLILLCIRLIGWKRRITPWLTGSVGLISLVMIGLMSAFHQPLARAKAVVDIPSPVSESDVWIYFRAWRPTRITEPWSAGTLLFPRSDNHLRTLDPVVLLREDGLAGWIELSLVPQATVCLVHRRQLGTFKTAGEDQLSPDALKTRFYTSFKNQTGHSRT